MTDAIRYVDGYLQNLMDGLHRANLDHCVNIIVTADHGECGTNHKKLGNGILYTDQIIDRTRNFQNREAPPPDLLM